MRNTIFLFLILAIAACVVWYFWNRIEIPKYPEFRRIENATFSGFSISPPSINLEARLVYYNPNTLGVTCKRLEADVFVEGNKTGRLIVKSEFKIGPQSEFSLPVETRISLAETDLLKKPLEILNPKRGKIETEIMLDGFLVVILKAKEIRIPFRHSQIFRASLPAQ